MSYFAGLCVTHDDWPRLRFILLAFDLIVIIALSDLLSQLSTQSSNPSKLSDDLSCLLTGFVPGAVSSNSDTLHSTAAELLSSKCGC